MFASLRPPLTLAEAQAGDLEDEWIRHGERSVPGTDVLIEVGIHYGAERSTVQCSAHPWPPDLDAALAEVVGSADAIEPERWEL